MPKSFKPPLAFLIFWLAFKISAQALPQINSQLPVKIQAEKLIYQREQNLIILSGNVEIISPPWQILAPKLELDLKTQTIRAEQGIKIIQARKKGIKEILSAQKAKLNLESQTGYLISAQLILPTEKTELRIEGDRLEKIGENLYYLKSGSFTSCQCPAEKTPDWEVRGKEIQADTSENLRMKQARILIRGRTIFFLPYFEYPISSERRSGFLPPEFTYTSRSGYQFGVPIYLVLSSWSDLTIYPYWLEQRGILGGAEYRYNLGPLSRAELRGFLINDRKEEQIRWSGQISGESSWKSGWLRADLKAISDNEYILDFDQNLAERWERAMESRLVFSQNLPRSSLAGEFNWLDDLAGWEIRTWGEREDQDEKIIQRLPSIYYQLYNQELGAGFGADLGGEINYYWREDKQLGRGIEASLFPRLNYSPRLGSGLRFFSFAGWQAYALHPDFEGAENSFLGRTRAGINLGVGLERIFSSEKTGNRYRHLFYPELMVNYYGKSPAPRDWFFEQIINTEESGEVGISLFNYLFEKPSQPASPVRLTSEFELRQFYNWTDEEFSDLEFRGKFKMGKALAMNLHLFYNLENWQWHRAQARLSYQDPKNRKIWLGYLYSQGEIKTSWYQYFQQEAENYDFGLSLPVSHRLGLEYRLSYSGYYQSLVRQSLKFDYLAKQRCWKFTLYLTQRLNPEKPDKPPEYSASVFFQIISSTDFKLGMNVPDLGSPTLDSARLNK